MKFHDGLSGLGLLALAAAIFWISRGFPSIAGDPVGPALFPRIIAVGLALAGLGLVIGAWRRRASEPWMVLPAWLWEPRLLVAFLIVTGGLLVYCLFVERIGFFICAPLLLGALLVVLRVRGVKVPVIAIGVTLVIHTIFYRGLGVPLPWGVFQAWAW